MAKSKNIQKKNESEKEKKRRSSISVARLVAKKINKQRSSGK